MVWENEVPERNDSWDVNEAKVVVQIKQFDDKLHRILSPNGCLRRLLLVTEIDQGKMASLFHCYGKIDCFQFTESWDTRSSTVDMLIELDQLDETVNFFKSIEHQNQPRKLIAYQESIEKILRERNEKIVTKYAKVMAPSDLLNLSQTTPANHVDKFSEQLLDIQQLRIIFDYFNEKGDGQKLIDFYGEKIGGAIENSLRSFNEYLSLSNGHRRSTCSRRSISVKTPLSLAAPGKIFDRLHNSLSPRRPSSSRRHSIMSSTLSADSLENNHSCIGTLLTLNNGLINSVAQTPDTKNYKSLLDGLVALLKQEVDLISLIFPTETKQDVLHSVLLSPMNFMQNIADDTCESIQGMTDKMGGDRQHVFGLFGIVQWFYRSENHFKNLFYSKDLDLEDVWFRVLSNIFEKSAMNCLDSALNEVRKDPTLPTSDASVHSLTSNVIEFMLDLINVGHIVDKHKVCSHINNDDTHPRARSLSFNTSESETLNSPLASYFAELLKELRKNLQEKAERYGSDDNQIIKFVFILNNTHCLIDKIDKSPLATMLKRNHSDLLLRLIRDYNHCMNVYSEPFTSLMELLKTTLKDDIMKNLKPKRLSQNERHWLKEKSLAINKSIGDLRHKLKRCHIDDSNLQEQLKNEKLEKLLQLFNVYHEKFSAAGFSENPQKHLIYTPSTFESIIGDLIDGK